MYGRRLMMMMLMTWNAALVRVTTCRYDILYVYSLVWKLDSSIASGLLRIAHATWVILVMERPYYRSFLGQRRSCG